MGKSIFSGPALVALASLVGATACGKEAEGGPLSTGGSTTGSATDTGGDSTTGGATSSEPGTSGASSTTEGSEESGSFLEMPDSGSVTKQCDIWAQDCPVGEKCMPWAADGGSSWNGTRCTPVDADPKQPGDECHTDGSDVSGNDDCALGSMCFSVNPETDVGTCVAFCGGSEQNPTCDDPATKCAISNDGVLILCLLTCDPTVQDCPTGGHQQQGCYPVNDGFQCWPDFSFDSGTFGDPCQYFNVCDPGLFCAIAEGVPNCQGSIGCCSEYCEVGSDSSVCSGAAQGQECVPFYGMGMAPPGLEHVGACLIPV